MEATAKGTLMDCEGCGELLADFLLDELPEPEAVLVHEHLLICPACMKAYRELKGTGKALEAVTSMQPLTPSDAFKARVREQAQMESEKIVSKLSPDRRLRLEARREARQSVRMSQRIPPKVWSPGLLILALGAAAILAVILFWPPKDKPVPRVALGTLSVAMGKVDQFYKKENQTYTPVEEGKPFLPGDSFKTGEQGRARFDLLDGGSLFAGPATDATFRFPQTEPGECTLLLDSGEIGVLRPETSASGTGKQQDWEIRSDAGTLTVAPSTHAYVRCVKASPNEKHCTLEVSVLTGCVHVLSHDGSKKESLYAGQKASIVSLDSTIATVSLTDEKPPAWRADLATATDLSAMLSGKVKIVSRHPGRLQIELTYNRETSNQDWTAEVPGVALGLKEGRLSCPTGVRWKHVAPFARPLTFELKLNADSRHDTSFAFGAFTSPAGDVAVDVSREAVLTVREKNKLPRRDHVSARGQPSAAESLVLQLRQEGLGYAATLSTTGGKTKSIPLWNDKPDAPGDVWFQALGEGLLLDEIKIAGTLPADWIREKMSGAQ